MLKHRTSERAFTRKRKLPFVSLVVFMLNLVKQTLQKELTHFISLVSEKKAENISKSAFCQSRMKLKHTAFIELNNVLLEEFYTDNIIVTWKGFRLLGTDGSKLQLPDSENLTEEFGYAKNQSDTGLAMAQVSTCYDVLNEIIVDTRIDRHETSEYTLALQHLSKAKQNDLFIYDRGYGGIWFMYYHVLKDNHFVMRMQRSSIAQIESFWESNETSQIIEITKLNINSKQQVNRLGLSFKPFKLRLVKVKLDNGETEVLVTSLLDEEKYPTEEFKELYAKRWGVEVNYDHLKNHLQIEDFTGLSPLSVRQDFFANAFIANLQSIIARDAQYELDGEKKGRKHRYKVNRNLSLGFMKDKVIQILLSNNPKYFEELKALFKVEPVPVRNGRKFPRIYHKIRRRKYHTNKKRAV